MKKGNVKIVSRMPDKLAKSYWWWWRADGKLKQELKTALARFKEKFNQLPNVIYLPKTVKETREFAFYAESLEGLFHAQIKERRQTQKTRKSAD